jgi:uncharacterized repeat protein (TIGR01451 family)
MKSFARLPPRKDRLDRNSDGFRDRDRSSITFDRLQSYFIRLGWIFFCGGSLSIAPIKSVLAAPTPISALNTTNITPSTSSYTVNGAVGSSYSATTSYTLKFGQGNNLRLDSIGIGGSLYQLQQTADSVVLRRKDNSNVTGIRNLLQFQQVSKSVNTINLAPSYADRMEDILLGNIINRGTDNIFTNNGDGSGNNNNIERVDFITSNGLTAPAAARLGQAGFLVLDRGGNDSFKIAAITALDSGGNPSTLGNLVSVSTWSNLGNPTVALVARRDGTATPLNPSTDTGSQAYQGVFISYSDLGIAAGQKFYGYVLLPNDVTVSNDLIGLTNVPTTTGAEGGLDLLSGGMSFTGYISTDLAITKTDNQTAAIAGSAIGYTITVKNQGGSTLTALKLTDVVPAAIQNSVFTPSIGTYTNTTGAWTGISLAPGAQITLTIAGTINPTFSGTLTNTATVEPPSNFEDFNLANNTATDTTTVQVSKSISGTVFEDVNYGGGAGRPLSTPGTAGRGNARVELYDGSGAFKGSVLTNTSGFYEFSSSNIVGGIVSGNYTVRVVNNTVTSARAGYVSTLVPVQTFRTNGLTNNIGTPDPNRVGGEAPQSVDANNSSTTLPATAQSISAITIGGDVTGINFGFNFDTIVNTNDSGQGSLRQFILNSNALTNTNLTGGKEVSIFMIPGQAGLSLGSLTTTATAGIRAGVANQLTNGVAIIKPTSPLPPITDANTTIDGSTQTVNVADTNTGSFGYAGLVGTGADGVSGTGDETSLAAINKPEVEIQGISGNVLDIQGTDAIVRGVAIRGTSGNSIPTGLFIQSGANNFLVENSMVGFSASNFTDPGASNRLNIAVNSSSPNMIVRNNLVGYVGSFGVVSSGSNTLVERNRFAKVGQESWSVNSRSEQMRYSGNGATIKDNYFGSTVVGQIDLGGAQNVLVDNNTLENGHSENSNDSYENGAIHARSGTTNITISHNIIRNTQQNAHGIMVHGNGNGAASSRVKITQNSIFNSGKLGINLNPTGQNPLNTDDDVTPNDGLTSATSGNNGMDYPFITSSKLNGSTLTLKGYVGSNNPLTRTNFAAATIEFFVAATNSNDLGPVFSTDPTTVAKLHAEGQTYLGKCTTDANGRFGTATSPCAISVPSGTDPLKITSTATDPNGNTSEFSAALGNDPQLVLVKRVTKIGTTDR